MSEMKKSIFPDIINSHPQADIPVDGLQSRLIQAGDQQIIFMEFDEDFEIPDHTHEAQWGVVLEGEMEITIDGEVKPLKKGDSYFIPKDVVHSARIKKGYKDLTLFDQKDRYQPKK